MAGRLVDERVAADAVLVPQIAPKPAPASAVAMPSLPGMRPTHAEAVLNRSSVTPDSNTKSATNRNIGMVIKFIRRHRRERRCSKNAEQHGGPAGHKQTDRSRKRHCKSDRRSDREQDKQQRKDRKRCHSKFDSWGGPAPCRTAAATQSDCARRRG